MRNGLIVAAQECRDVVKARGQLRPDVPLPDIFGMAMGVPPQFINFLLQPLLGSPLGMGQRW